MQGQESTWSPTEIVGLLERVPLFQGLPRADLERIGGLVRGRSAETGELLFREGDAGDRLYIVFAGAVEILKERPRGEHERLAVKRPGEAFGEMALLTDAPRSASARAAEPTRLLAVDRAAFAELLGGETLAVRLMRGLAKALRALDVRFAARVGAPAGGGELEELGRVLRRGLLPRRVPETPRWDVAAALVGPEDRAGNVLWDAVPVADGAVAALFDVKGSELPPAWFLGIARALLREALRAGRAFDALLPALTEGVTENLFEGLDECVSAALIGFHPDGARWAAAGEPVGLVVGADGRVQELPSHGPPLGILPRFDYGVTRLALDPGAVLVAFSEAERGLVLGAGELVRAHRRKPAAQIAGLLQTALGAARERGAAEHMAVLVGRRM